MAQRIVAQIYDATSTAGGNLTFGPYPSLELTALLVSINVASAQTGTVTLSAVRDDASLVTILTAANVATGTTWAYSICDQTAVGAAAVPVMPSKVKLTVVGATTSVARVTIWAVKLS